MIDIKKYSFPKEPGIYIFKDEYNDFLYIGKAKNLEKRIHSYNTDKQVDWKIESLLKKAIIIEWIVCKNEKEALFLEAKLISEHKPLFNRLLVSTNPFTYIVFTEEKNTLPKITITRYYKKKEKTRIIGPFLTKKEAISLYQNIIQLFNLAICNKNIPHGCLAYHIGKCAGSCLEKFDIKMYKKRFDFAIESLLNSEKFEKKITEEIKKATKKFDFIFLEELITYQTEFKNAIALQKDFYNFNEQEIIERTLLDFTIKKDILEQGLKNLQLLLELSFLPNTVDCIDISHFQGHAVVGSCIRFTNGIFDKSGSKSYKLPYEQNNDYHNLLLLIELHYLTENFILPDILLIDGGKGQLNTVKKLHLKTELIALAKKEERLFTLKKKEEIALTPKEPLGILLLSLRNMTHNAAIKLHSKFFSTIK